MNNFHRTFSRGLMLATLASVAFAVPAEAAGSFALYAPPADDTIVSQGPPSPNHAVVKGVSSPTGYAGMEWQAPAGFTFADLATLSSDYQMLGGSTFHGGSPRFTLFDNNFNSAYTYWGTPTGGGSFSDPNGGVYGNTSNYIAPLSTDARWAANGFGGVNTPNTIQTYAGFALAVPATTPITFITLDLDGGFAGQQTMVFDNFTVNNMVYDAQFVPEPASLALALMGLFGLCAYAVSRRWKRRRVTSGI